ncbi:hypothetical protein P170DRAFT_64857 [Aspergillus steynii IBT 23096]|uniref:Uncharacterized protein n=1 Tax=Aspergillus steynii IBT 23096 TaxID=1392250 RepID=A0A2I2FTE4_9EURO|nr:uncharacterized protein P170DRAFT_64857 [Aspergillus steynii IBT 23096]PLB43913.1 hypothetical protein P170DRAFT_64857 [Aspergillus steynii IBT 23096]
MIPRARVLVSFFGVCHGLQFVFLSGWFWDSTPCFDSACEFGSGWTFLFFDIHMEALVYWHVSTTTTYCNTYNMATGRCVGSIVSHSLHTHTLHTFHTLFVTIFHRTFVRLWRSGHRSFNALKFLRTGSFQIQLDKHWVLCSRLRQHDNPAERRQTSGVPHTPHS